MTISLSVIIPTYGRADSVGRLLDALRSQSIRERLEIVVVDQNDPGFLRDELGERMDGVMHVHLDVPNVSTARNVGFVKSTAEHVLFMDDDFIPDPDFCEQGLARLQQHEDVSFIVPVIYSNKWPRERALARWRDNRGMYAHHADPSFFRMREAGSAVIFTTRAIYERSGGFDEPLFAYARAGEDYEYYRRLMKRGIRAWMDTKLFIRHDEDVPGGCDMRTIDRFENHKRGVKAWSLLARTHSTKGGRIGIGEAAMLARNSVVNRRVLTGGPGLVMKELTLLREVLLDSRREYREQGGVYGDPLTVDFVSPHKG